jgi:hypothetical protein
MRCFCMKRNGILLPFWNAKFQWNLVSYTFRKIIGLDSVFNSSERHRGSTTLFAINRTDSLGLLCLVHPPHLDNGCALGTICWVNSTIIRWKIDFATSTDRYVKDWSTNGNLCGLHTLLLINTNTLVSKTV